MPASAAASVGVLVATGRLWSLLPQARTRKNGDVIVTVNVAADRGGRGEGRRGGAVGRVMTVVVVVVVVV